MKYIAKVGDTTFTVEIAPDGQVLVDGKPVSVDLQPVEEPYLYSLLLDHVSYEAYAERRGEVWRILLRGQEHAVDVREEWTHGLEGSPEGWGPPTGPAVVRAPLPGLVLQVLAQEGQEVVAGDLLLLLETMKMETELRAPRAGTVRRVYVAQGQSVAGDQPLVEIG
ncbi:MAG: acetyl-CoA carboxylase biotin carboxyl carrier protein subunit [Anaerolineae bacterium]